MGKATTRITAEDFVTPPELAGFRLAANGAGRIGGARLSLEAGGVRTHLADCYQQVPLRVLPLSFGPAEPALIYLLNPTAGLFDGDAQLVEVQAGPGSRAVVTGQSATRIHPCLDGFSTQQWHIRVAAGAVLLVLPGPAIPFQGCRYFQRVSVDLEEGAQFIWGDIWLAGRYARAALSERFQFRSLIQDLTVRRAGQLVFRDRFCWQGPWDEETAHWHFGPTEAYGSLFSTIGQSTDASPLEREHDPAPVRTREAIFQTAALHTCRRWLGSTEAVIAAVTCAAFSLAGAAEDNGKPWLLTDHHLAPNHWFCGQNGTATAAGACVGTS